MLIMPPDLALLSTLISSNYPCLELIFMVLKVFEPLKFDCSIGFRRYDNSSVGVCFDQSFSVPFQIHLKFAWLCCLLSE